MGSKRARKKQPSHIEPVRTGKHARSDPSLTESIKNKSPVWRVRRIDHGGPWGWGSAAGADIHAVLEKLGHFESMTWGEIESKRGKHGAQSHVMPVDRISKDAQDRLREIKHDDLEELYSLRLSGKKRVWGIRIGACMDVLWWDPEHEVYPVRKRHT